MRLSQRDLSTMILHSTMIVPYILFPLSMLFQTSLFLWLYSLSSFRCYNINICTISYLFESKPGISIYYSKAIRLRDTFSIVFQKARPTSGIIDYRATHRNRSRRLIPQLVCFNKFLRLLLYNSRAYCYGNTSVYVRGLHFP